MKKFLFTLAFLSVCQSSLSYAVDFEYKETKDFAALETFKSVEAFETDYGKYVQQCLDTFGGSSGGIPCFIGHELWDRELNTYYNKLAAKLNKNDKALLKKAQIAWLKQRDLNIEFTSKLLDKKYTEQGTMYQFMRAEEANSLLTPVIKQRALMLKQWLEALEEKLEF